MLAWNTCLNVTFHKLATKIEKISSVLRRLSKPLLKRTNDPDSANIPGRSRLSRGEECPQLALRLQERELSILCRRRKWKNTIRCLKKLPSSTDTVLKHGMVDIMLRSIPTFGFVDPYDLSRTEQNIPKLRMRGQVNYRILISMPSIFFSCNFFNRARRCQVHLSTIAFVATGVVVSHKHSHLTNMSMVIEILFSSCEMYKFTWTLPY